MSNPKRAVISHYRPIKKITPLDIQQMYEIFRKYYANTTLEIFLRDLGKKQGLFLIRDRETRRIVGFSTVTNMPLKYGKRTVRGVFSGDTIIEREYWGCRALNKLFFLYMLRTRLRYPTTPVFWLLISKGYKTYLLLANNFPRYYPHPEGRYDRYAPMVREYCDALFPGCFDPERGLLDFGKDYQHLEGDVAEITAEMRRKSAKIDFFERSNPSWREGTELPCIGQAGYLDFLLYIRDRFFRRSAPVRIATPAQEEADEVSGAATQQGSS